MPASDRIRWWLISGNIHGPRVVEGQEGRLVNHGKADPLAHMMIMAACRKFMLPMMELAVALSSHADP